MLLSVIVLLPPVHAHTTVAVESYSIEVGWGTEPPVVGYRNSIVFYISEQGESEGVSAGVRNAFGDLDAVIKFGGVTKPLDINADVKSGHYFANIIPTRTGTYSVELSGTIGDSAVSVDVPVEDAENTAILDFPPRPAGNENTGQLQQAISAMQQDLASLQKDGIPAGEGQNSGAAYDFAIMALSIGVAAIIIAIWTALSLNAKKHQQLITKMTETAKFYEKQLDDMRRILEKNKTKDF